MDKITILYEDSHMVAISKPAGLMVHADGRSQESTVVDWFLDAYPASHSVGEEPIETQGGVVIKRPGIVHRLDKDTSGVMLLAKTQEGHTHLKEQFQSRSIAKVYRALVYGHMKNNSYTVEAPIGRAKTFGRWTAIPKAIRGNTREAETMIDVLSRFEVDGEQYSYIEARPKTGRTHQIRVHLQYLNYPIVADSLYAGKRNKESANLGCAQQALHAYQIILKDLEDKGITIRADLPLYFHNVIGKKSK